MDTTTSSPTARRALSRYLPGIDGLRAISVLAVLLYHNWAPGLGGSNKGEGPFPGGFLGVEVFFVVSGYLITSLILRERRETGAVSLKTFWIRRARRLLPALFLMLGVTVLYTLMFLPDAVGELKGDVLAALTYTSNWWQIATHRSYIQDAAGRTALLRHLWSLAIEEQFYLLWPPALVYGLRRFPRTQFLRIVLAAALASAVLMAAISHRSINFAYFSTLARMSGLLLGAALAFVFAPHLIRGRPGRGARAVLDVAGLGGLVVLLWCFHNFHFTPDSGVWNGGFLLVDVATVLVIAAVVHPASDVGPVLGVQPLQWIGLRSYGVYLWHYPVFAITRPALDHGHFWNLRGGPCLVLRFGLTFVLAALSYHYVERPIRHGAIAQYVARLRETSGSRRRRLALPGLSVTAGIVAVAVVLGGSLANAQPERVRIHGIAPDAEKNTRGDQPDPKAFEAAKRAAAAAAASTTVSTTVPPTVAPVGPTTVPPDTAAPPPTTPPPPVVPPGTTVLAIGDSVLLGASGSLRQAIPGVVIDAVVSRQFWQAAPVLQQYLNVLPPTAAVLIHLGTNGMFTDGQLDDVVRLLGDRAVYIVTARVPTRGWQDGNNDRIRAAPGRWPNVKVIEWFGHANPHPEWFEPDMFHVNAVGAQNYAAFVKQAVFGG